MTRAGILLPTREAFISGSSDARSLIELAITAEERGFDSVWAGDSLVARPRLEPLTLLAAVAARTERVTVGTAALTGALRHPLLAAHVIATLDQISDGRLILGLGAGFPYPETQAEFEAAGVPFHERVGRLLETVRLWRQIWETDPASEFSGRYWNFEGIDQIPKPRTESGPPLWLAGAGDNALKNTGRFFDGWLPYPPTPDEYRTGWDRIRQSAQSADHREKDLTPAVYVTINLQDDEEQALKELDDYCTAYYGFPLEVMRSLQGFYGGDAERCSDWIREYIAAGAAHVILRFGSFDSRAQLERSADQLLAKLKTE